jgi:hypothetical protein
MSDPNYAVNPQLSEEATVSGGKTFIERDPSLESYWRAIVLFGRNVASYKFALAKSLVERSPAAGEIISLEELAEPFSRHVCEHLKIADKQGTSQQSHFLEACRRFNKAEISRHDLVDATVRLGFNNVIDAFHVVNNEQIALRFFTDARKGTSPWGSIEKNDISRRSVPARQTRNRPPPGAAGSTVGQSPAKALSRAATCSTRRVGIGE